MKTHYNWLRNANYAQGKPLTNKTRKSLIKYSVKEINFIFWNQLCSLFSK